MKKIIVSAPGKIHFLGEHTAVYFKPAILAAIDKRCTVELIPTESKEIRITSGNFVKEITVSAKEILHITETARQKWKLYRKTNDIAILKSILTADADYPLIAIGETLKYFNMDLKNGFHMNIDSQIPIGSGLGSSAAVALTIVTAVAKFLQQGLSFPRKRESNDHGSRPSVLRLRLEEIKFGMTFTEGMISKQILSKIAIHVEQKMHGNPSYGDVAAVSHGGLIWFQKKTPDSITIEPLPFSMPKSLSKNMRLINSGKPHESTGEMVHHVALLKQQNPAFFETVLDHQEKLTHDLLDAIKNADEAKVMDIISKGEKNLESLGVVSETTKSLIRQIERSGGAAKICGAGGITKGSGIVLVYHPDKSKIVNLAKEKGLQYYQVQLEGKGLVIE